MPYSITEIGGHPMTREEIIKDREDRMAAERLKFVKLTEAEIQYLINNGRLNPARIKRRYRKPTIEAKR